MKTAQEYFEKTVKEFVYPVEQATQKDVDWIVTPILEAMKDFLNQERENPPEPIGSQGIKTRYKIFDELLSKLSINQKPIGDKTK
jgi:hypothetical protein